MFLMPGSRAHLRAQTRLVVGSNTAITARTGYLGQYAVGSLSSGSAVTLASGTPANLTSIPLTPGDWDVWANGYFNGGGATVVARAEMSISSVSSTQNFTNGQIAYFPSGFATDIPFSNDPLYLSVGPFRANIATPATYNLVGLCVFTTSNAFAYGIIQARRVV